MKKNNYLIILLLTFVINGCSFIGGKPEPKVITKTEIKVPSIIHPKPVEKLNLKDVEWFVFNKEKLRKLIEKADNKNEELSLLAVNPKGYENISLNVQEMKRYILQQKEVIYFYKRVYEDFEKNAKNE